ncbi:hypothetical protein NBRC10512_006563 [Rhodotorula toruloides]|uniref:RHTO0S10e04236g1_1 n=2 Tax=Rhodotorula toruloides TaxID=5286 RepID=A0A061B6K2_RHOTO|nr:uncharacterized protein RHTO_08166 [Rhodotorula toruloides NP11]EMS22813.1 hypothetical protein RHTO_08166 [Rhodotorula toruloides NP11]CDR45020.1 RHTO0S10e04236g1_1 [Rhodotorula toruloides]
MDSSAVSRAPSPAPTPRHIPSLPSLLPAPAAPPAKRTNLVELKLRLAELLTPEQGAVYWAGLGDFVCGRINRQEWDEVLKRAFGKDRARRAEAVKLHNALLLAILYNTTRPFLPPSSVRHSGFHPRGAKKRGLAAGEGGEVEEKRRRLLKDKVMALGRRERGDVKLLGTASAGPASASSGRGKGLAAVEEERKRKRRAGEALSEAMGGASRGGGGRIEMDGVPRALREREKEGAPLPPTLSQDYLRLVQTPLCCESRVLPDSETLRDRMTATAYEEGLAEGVEGRASTLVQGAMEHHLKNMLAAVVSLVRGTRQAAPPPPRTASSSTVSTPAPYSTSTFAPAGSAPSAPSPAPPAAASPAPDASLSQEPVDEREPLTIADFHALFAISPSLLGQHPNVGAVERMYALPPPDSDTSDEDESEAEREEAHAQARTADQQKALEAARDAEGATEMLGAKPLNAAVATLSSGASSSTGMGAGKKPRLSRSRASSFYGATRPVPVSAPSFASGIKGKGRFVIDPSSLHGIPEGHPAVPHLPSTPQPLLPAHLAGPPVPSASPAAAAAASASTTAPGQLSPKSLALRNSLFPELMGESGTATPAGDAVSNGDGNGTTTDGGESESEDDGKGLSGTPAPPSTGLKIKLGNSAVGQAGQTGRRASMSGPPGAGRPMPTNEKDREAGRKLWEVVDSVGLLNGVLQ